MKQMGMISRIIATDGHDFTHHSDDDTNVPLPSVAAPEPDHDTDTQALDLETGLTDSLVSLTMLKHDLQ
ncbi:hypothetical protein DPMN_119042 [Dreissena polymorpha]|uniref:Uncharacterized protein n=1 Tax=Dreissena polymorpha TaxID=45954 RepID=A0A9D4JP23_DREPO|nr:hypothetical protein DPMN_119042 [Dreissena polymorpha]